jgi:transcriptional regulator with XRE-family HTH domain
MIESVKKTLYSDEHRLFLALLRKVRVEAGLTQAIVAKRLAVPQSYVSDYETGSRKLDTLQMRQVCAAMETTLPEFTARLEDVIIEAEHSVSSGV